MLQAKAVIRITMLILFMVLYFTYSFTKQRTTVIGLNIIKKRISTLWAYKYGMLHCKYVFDGECKLKWTSVVIKTVMSRI